MFDDDDSQDGPLFFAEYFDRDIHEMAHTSGMLCQPCLEHYQRQGTMMNFREACDEDGNTCENHFNCWA